MSSILDVNERKLPSFKEWIEAHSPGTQADGFAAFRDLALLSQDSDLQPNLTPQQKSFARMWIGCCTAAVELCNMEALTHDRPHHEIIATLPRAFAAATMYAIASVCGGDTPLRDIAKIVTEEFRAAAKTAADGLESDNSETPAHG